MKNNILLVLMVCCFLNCISQNVARKAIDGPPNPKRSVYTGSTEYIDPSKNTNATNSNNLNYNNSSNTNNLATNIADLANSLLRLAANNKQKKLELRESEKEYENVPKKSSTQPTNIESIVDPAQLNELGLKYLNEKEYPKAISFFEKGVRNNSAIAALNLGSMFYDGEGVDKNAKIAFNLFIIAAKMGDSGGLDLVVNAAKQNIPEAQVSLSEYLIETDSVEAFSWLQKALSQNSPYAFLLMARCFRNGQLVEKNISKCLDFYDKAAKLNLVDAQIEIGDMYINGDNVKIDYSKSFNYFKMAAMLNDAPAQFVLGQHYKFGLGVDKNYNEAFELFKKLSQQGDSDAKFELGEMYFKGQGVDQNYSEAFKLLHQDEIMYLNEKAQYYLGLMYLDGKGINKDYDAAVMWFKGAAINGNQDAISKLKELGIK